MEEEKILNAPKDFLKLPSGKGEKKRKRDLYFEMILFLILGILVGIAAKTEAAQRITLGFEDYKLKKIVQYYDISQLQLELAEKEKNLQPSGAESASGGGGIQVGN